MKHVSRAIGLAGFCAFWAVLCLAMPGAAQSATVAIVHDGQVAGVDLTADIEAELQRVLGTRRSITIKSPPEFDANWDINRAPDVLRAAMNDPEVDIVIGTGSFVTRAAADPSYDLPKPFISSFVQRTPLFGIPYTELGSSKKNLTFVIIPRGVARDIEVMQQLNPFDKIHVVAGDELIPLIREFEGVREYARDSLQVDFELLGVTPESPIPNIPEEAQVIYLGRTPRLTSEQRAQMIESITARGYPTFSLVGHSDVYKGALAGLMPDVYDLVIRRVALNVGALLRGETVEELPVVLAVDTRLMLNGSTAERIGYFPNFETIALAEVINVQALEADSQPLDFGGALSLAEDRNINLYVKDADVEVTLRDKQVARSPLLPQVGAVGSYANNQPIVPAAILPTDVGNVGLRVSQMIFDDRAISDFRSSGRRYEANVLARETTRLDVLTAAGTEFLEYVLRRILVSVDSENVQLTADNLELSKVRYEVGYSGQDEVFRWTAELAESRSRLLRSATDMESSRIAFNQVLGVEQDRRWLPKEVEVDPDEFTLLDGRLSDLYRNNNTRPSLRDAIVKIAIDNAPELGFYQKAIEAQDIQVAQRTRSFLIPQFFLQFQYDYFWEFEPRIDGQRDDQYTLAVVAQYPIFNGANRYYDRERQKASLVGLHSERERARQLVERRARTAFTRVENSFPIIKLSVEAAENADANFQIVQEKYAQGIVNVTDLLQAQNQAFNTNQNAAASVYSFLIDLVQLQRAISWFEAEQPEAEQADLVRRIRDYVVGN